MNRKTGGVVTCVLAVSVFAATARAQETRAEIVAAEQKAKAASLTPWEPNKAEATFLKFKRELIDSPDGFYPTFDSVYSGGGFTAGVGYRRYYAPNAFWNAHGSYSVSGYNLFELSTTARGLLGTRSFVTARAGRREATSVDYWGVGNDTPADRIGEFQFTQLYVGANAEGGFARFMRVGGGLEYEDYQDESKTDALTPPSGLAPGLGASPDYVHAQAMLAFDSRTSPGYTRSGGLYGVSAHAYMDQNDGTYSFERIDVDLVQHLPVFRDTWVVSLRGRAQTTIGNDTVPYLLIPSIGGGHSLRAYSSWRFRDLHTLLTSAEWRWFPNLDGLDMALFFDAGKVASERSGLNFSDLHTDWGVGARFHGAFATPLRLDLAHGSEGWHLNFTGSAAF